MLAGAREALPENRTQLALQLRWSSHARTLSGAQVVNAAGDQRLTAAFASASVQHFLGHGWSVDLSVPVGVVQLESNTSPSASTLVGLGDIEVGGRYDFAALWGAVGYRPSLTLRLGLGFPSGRRGTFDAPGLAPNLVATGSGTNSMSGNLAFTQFVHKQVGLHAWLGGWAPLDRADDGLRPGPQLTCGLGGFWQVMRPLAVAARLDGRSTGRADERENGTVLASGGHTVAAEADLTWFITPEVAISVGGRVPVWAWVNGQQLAETASITTGVVVGLQGEEDHTGHHHGPNGTH